MDLGNPAIFNGGTDYSRHLAAAYTRAW